MGASRARRPRLLVSIAALALACAAIGSATSDTKVTAVPAVPAVPAGGAPHVEPRGGGTPNPSDEIGVSDDAITVGVVASRQVGYRFATLQPRDGWIRLRRDFRHL